MTNQSCGKGKEDEHCTELIGKDISDNHGCPWGSWAMRNFKVVCDTICVRFLGYNGHFGSSIMVLRPFVVFIWTWQWNGFVIKLAFNSLLRYYTIYTHLHKYNTLLPHCSLTAVDIWSGITSLGNIWDSLESSSLCEVQHTGSVILSHM